MPGTGTAKQIRVYVRETDKGLHQTKVHFEQARAVSSYGREKVIEQVIVLTLMSN
ncbi:hypothetical protein [Pseudomonas azerbaijanorientalis]|jgi:hypothetical protein|uniref:Uncharacterized protein n=1 Tax=Pseudomonas azerbaijanorientalis TaxID=2842350 RepID=A0ABW8W4A6_9PSED